MIVSVPCKVLSNRRNVLFVAPYLTRSQTISERTFVSWWERCCRNFACGYSLGSPDEIISTSHLTIPLTQLGDKFTDPPWEMESPLRKIIVIVSVSCLGRRDLLGDNSPSASRDSGHTCVMEMISICNILPRAWVRNLCLSVDTNMKLSYPFFFFWCPEGTTDKELMFPIPAISQLTWSQKKNIKK